VSDVNKFISSNTLAITGLALDTTSFGLEFVGAATGSPLLSAAGASVGFAGTVVSAIGCNDNGGLACVGFGIGAIATTAGIVETGLEIGAAAPAAAALLQGAGVTFGGASVVTDIAAVLTTIHKVVRKSAKRVARKVTKF
jgi:hypothetical protein